ncbi:MAG: hypothetical protein GY727_05655 [Gammaproteobacteria bacterium]|nr:hypothetical protein [Gammaproteobacteria bacterium]MCP4090476.1 hypothetical protein [Gammaproteobacteria bacterium]MCP4276659.1 hypothetical protein [Gammaproteobacteria bacterium]MCP4831409.1 hypothetical protein [Gammaproteobacteria bacterium]MCP4927953.1 hypothetical protein [Gammaproteobacteria bacterium]
MSTKFSLVLLCVLFASSAYTSVTPDTKRPLIGVVFLVHGGFDKFSDAALWDSTLQIFSYDPNSFVYQKVIWNPGAWPMILRAGNAPKELGKYAFESERIGGPDPAMEYSRQQLADMTATLKLAEAELGVRFITDYVNWIGDIKHLPQPRNIYMPGIEGGTPVSWCGEQQKGGDGWPECNPQRYDTDGTIDRMLRAGVEKILVIDLTTSGVRFFKSNDVIRLSREVVAEYNSFNNTDVTLHWLNDPTDLMRDSYPDKPAGWTSSLGKPEHDPSIPLKSRGNPVSADPVLATLHVEGIEQHLNENVPIDKTGVLLVNHATRKYNQLFDPKIDDTLILNANIRDQLLQRNPELNADNIVGAWMGIKEANPAIKPRPPSSSKLERTRRMRGENLGHAYLYETDEAFPTGQWGYFYWDALERLKNNGVEHIIIAFPQIMVDSVLNLVELPNQVAKEIGYKNWLYINEPDLANYPDVGHPFADYWGVWVKQMCPVADSSDQLQPCCFEMGGCSDGRPYPPLRLAPVDKARNDLDPSLAYDVSEYGHLGYDPAKGQPDPAQAVQKQYTGTWATWTPPNTDPRVGQTLAKHVISYLQGSQ